MKKIILLIFTLSILFSCTNDSEEDLIDVVVPPVLVTYNTDVKDIIDNNCIICHLQPPVNGASIPLLIYDNVKNAVENSNLIGRISAKVVGHFIGKWTSVARGGRCLAV